MSYRALALDLDGTLLGPDDAVSPRNRAAVEAAVTEGWHVILATARWYQLAERTAHDLGLVDPVIACSGAEVRRLRDGADLFDVRLPAAFASALYELCDGEGGMAFVYQDRDVVLKTAVPRSLQALPEVRSVPLLAGGADPAPRCVLLFGDELNAIVLETLLPLWGEEVRFLTSMTGQGHPILTLTSAEADKGLALGVACADLDIPLSEVVAMGDSETDIEMFNVAGASVAMGQASAAVKQSATWVTASHGDDGVGLAIEDLLLGGAVGP
jgi:hydroxymethylpyrimidine pyrophosphatase-like HAD family hydrolase